MADMRSWILEANFACLSRQVFGQWMVEDIHGELVPAPSDPYNDDQAREIFAEAIVNIQNVVSEVLEEDIPITVLSIPSHFNSSSKSSLWDAIRDAGQPIHRPWQIERWLNTARLAYGLNSCKAFGLTREKCDIDDGPHQIVYADYRFDSLELRVADISEHGAFPEYRSLVADLGFNRGRDILRIRDALDLLVTSYFVVKTPQYDRFDFLRAIILSGETAEPLMKELRAAVAEAFPGHKDKIRDSIDPLYVGAAGAAYQARQFALHPDLLKDIEPCPSDHESEHDEL